MPEPKAKNIKVPLELLELIEKRTGTTKNPGKTLLEIVQEYEKVEMLMQCVSDGTETTSVYDALKTYMDNWGKRFDGFQNSIDQLNIMLKSYLEKLKPP